MDFSSEYNKEQEAFAKEVRAWLDENVPEGIHKARHAKPMTKEQYQMRRELALKMGEKGWLYPDYPKEYGGGNLDAAYSAVLFREFAARGLSIPPYYDSARLASPAILVCGTEEQKKRLLPPMLKGEIVTWQLFTEPEAGTDEANQQTDALKSVREKDHFIVNGSKIFVGGRFSPPGLSPPGQFLLLTRSNPDGPRHRNLAMFVAPSNLPGIEIQPLDLFTNSTFSETYYEDADSGPGVKNSIFFKDVKIHEDYLIGGDNEGWKAATATLTVEHGDKGESGVYSGGLDSAVYIPKNVMVDTFMDICKNDPNVKKRLKDNPNLQEAMVDIFINGEIERLLATRNAALVRSNIRTPYAGPQHSLFMKMFGNEFTAKAAQVLGPYVLTDDEQWSLAHDLIEVGERNGVCTSPGGTPEALKIIMSRSLRIGR